jgi:hypothetical protein
VKLNLTTILLAASLTAGGALAQSAPVGGSDAKGNAPIKHVHTVNDGSAKPGANSFTQGQAMHHIENSGYTGVSGLAKGHDGVWRGMAMKNGAPVNVAMDFKGNVTQGMVETSRPAPTTQRMAPLSERPAPMTSSEASSSAMSPIHHRHHWRRHHHWRHHFMKACNTTPGPNGVACSGRDHNRNGISDKEDRAIRAGAKP